MSEERGTDFEACGTYEEPCRTLRMAVVQVEDSQTIYVDGNHIIDKTIRLHKSVNFCGVTKTGKMIIKSSGRIHVFQAMAEVKISFTSLEFQDIRLLMMSYSVSIVISNCSFVGTYLKHGEGWGLGPDFNL